MKRIIQAFGYLGSTILTAALLSWICVFLINGLPGVYAWMALKFIIPMLGFVGVLLNIFLILVSIIKKNRISDKWMPLVLCTVLASHFFLTMNIIQLAYPVRIINVHPSVTVKWPFSEQAIVGWGGDSTDNNLPHATWPSERWAYDLVMEPYNTGSTSLEDYGIWKQKVLSPVSGTVIAAFDDESDIVPGTEKFISMEGNHVYLRIDATGTYLLLNHLKQDSVTVAVGDHVNAGEVLGHVGNSGSTSEPHLHIHHQRQDPTQTLLPILAEGLPLYFEDTNAKAMPLKGTEVTPMRNEP
ncbi:peptidase M24 [Paenibacillus odorifer]|uniref:Peptidase M24 n=1 Tax=Paenibacillus odorifer TaxID=189426 RepID=A0A1R0ZE43_9BACL|nr:M23 family metallopeptidase [Paenibacillus odorifer]OMD52192.1 peptidase M24 [Paenibacillus odorifer]OME67952.1 peptidase M24 [Paenibacillus odorifer]